MGATASCRVRPFAAQDCGPDQEGEANRLLREQGISLSADDGLQIRVFDATTVKEPGGTGS